MEYTLLSEVGTRSVNEDYVKAVSKQNSYLFCLADGLGGHGSGDLASRLVVEEAARVFLEESGDMDDIAVVQKCFLVAQESLLAEQIRLGLTEQMKSTLVLLHICDGRMLWGHVGDSRCYHFSKNKLVMRTLDHSVPQMLVATGEIKEKDIRFHEDRNRLIRVMGTEWNQPKYELSQPRELANGDAFLLCTDGFWEWLNEGDMQKLLKKSRDSQGWLQLMNGLIKKNAKKQSQDNCSAIAVRI